MRYVAWVGFAIVAIAYATMQALDHRHERSIALERRLGPWRDAFRSKYVSEEFMLSEDG